VAVADDLPPAGLVLEVGVGVDPGGDLSLDGLGWLGRDMKAAGCANPAAETRDALSVKTARCAVGPQPWDKVGGQKVKSTERRAVAQGKSSREER
jgi:hypothetical protein